MDEQAHVLVAAALLAAIHPAASRIPPLRQVPRTRWLSFAGGISVAYVFVHLLPELAARQAAIGPAVERWTVALEHHAYLAALAGLVVFYGLEHAARRDRQGRQGPGHGEEQTSAAVYRLSIASFSLYNALVGYLLVEQVSHGASNLYVFTAAMAVHFLVNDYALLRHHQERYVRNGRWILSGAVLAGALVEPLAPMPEAAVGALVALLAGGLVLNVLKEELPEERDGRFGPFVVGAAGYAALLQVVQG